jgi:cystathionine beta-lyase/cystathionine gamma-synthase
MRDISYIYLLKHRKLSVMKKKINTRRVPVYRDAAFDLRDADTTVAAFDADSENPLEIKDFIYSRYRNPTVMAVEERLAALEGAAWAFLTQSGMAAIDTALSVFQEAGRERPWLFFSEIYGGTNTFIDEVLVRRRGITVHRFSGAKDHYDLEALQRMLEELHPALLYFEAVSNPMLTVADGQQVIRMAKEAGAAVIIDNTFATPYLWKPLADGADLVVHSATKYLSGHGNMLAGVVCGRDRALAGEVNVYRKLTGHLLPPDEAARLGDQMLTFSLRMERHCHNALQVARLLAQHPAVEKVYFPGLEEHPTHAEALRLFGGRGYGGMVTFDMAGGDDEEKRSNRDRFIRSVAEEITLMPTLGNTETTLLPIEAVWGDQYPGAGMIRMSVGIEETEELKEVIRRGLEEGEEG